MSLHTTDNESEISEFRRKEVSLDEKSFFRKPFIFVIAVIALLFIFSITDRNDGAVQMGGYSLFSSRERRADDVLIRKGYL